MTIAISIKVHDGLVLASDSASTVFATTPAGQRGVLNVYNSANKIFNLSKGERIGCMTWGSGSIGPASISTIIKDLRKEMISNSEYKFDSQNYKIEEIAKLCREYVMKQYKKEFTKLIGEKPILGFLIAGYSSRETLAEEWLIQIDNEGKCTDPKAVRDKKETGIFWAGRPEAITRLMTGHGVGLPNIMKELGVPDGQITPAIKKIEESLTLDFAPAPMPIQDAIDLAEFLVHTTIMFERFGPGAPTVGGPIEIAAITKHEGFKWIKRKHYYKRKYNLPQNENPQEDL